MFDIVIRRGDTLPKIEKKIYVSGSPFDPTGYTLSFIVSSLDGVQIFANPAEIIDAPNGVIGYQWTDADSTAVVGDIVFARFEAVEGSDKFTVPNNRPLSIMVTSNTSNEYSYSGDPSARPIDRVRFLLSDTDMDKALFTDSEIAYLLLEFTSPYAAAAEAAAIQSSRYTRLAKKTVGPLSIDYGSLSSQWAALEKSLLRRRRQGGAIAITTQNSTSPYFRLGQMDNPEIMKNDKILGDEDVVVI